MVAKVTLAALLAASLAVASPVAPRDKGGNGKGKGQTLGQLAKKNNGRYFGNAVEPSYFSIPQYNSILEQQFTSLSPENVMKWEVIHPQPNVYDFSGADAMFAKAKEMGAEVRGHNFVWHQQTPSWVTSITDPTELKQVLHDHIFTIIQRYGSQLQYFDVINEPVDDASPPALRKDVWYNVLGEDYLAIALNYAKEAADSVGANIKFMINDYNVETQNQKQAFYVQLAKKLLAEGAPLDGIGFESHFIVGETPQDQAAAMKDFTDLGLIVAITELDVRGPVDANDNASPATLAQQAKDYATSVQACLDTPKCVGITEWEFVDSVSWIPATFPGEGAADLYFANYTAKPSFYSTQQTLQSNVGGK